MPQSFPLAKMPQRGCINRKGAPKGAPSNRECAAASAAAACRVVAKGLVAQPQPLVAAVGGLAHHLGLVRIGKPLGDFLALRRCQAAVGDLLDAVAKAGRGRGAVRLAAGAFNGAGLSARRRQRGQKAGAERGCQESFHLLMPRVWQAGLMPAVLAAVWQMRGCVSIVVNGE